MSYLLSGNLAERIVPSFRLMQPVLALNGRAEIYMYNYACSSRSSPSSNIQKIVIIPIYSYQETLQCRLKHSNVYQSCYQSELQHRYTQRMTI